ncbi:hypothetical protein LCGC14_1521300 [marine sediment metagenome]|uniref:Uncharacterized protein n=1 Tax=marine sediment metagenome TaxID=412755 RepID=A0A0F9LZM0_9ZZZZ
MDRSVTWNELRAILNLRLKDGDVIDWIELSHPGLADPIIIRYNVNHVKIYDKQLPDILGGGTIPTKKKKRKSITSLIPATKKKKKTKKKKR